MKTKFILHGGFTSTKNELNRSFYEEISKTVPNNGSILLIYFSRDDSEIIRLYQEDKERIIKQAGEKDLDIVLATKEDFIEQLEQADSIYMRGGDTDKLLASLKEFQNFKDLVRGKCVAGSSAGAYVIGQYSVGHSVTYIREGLGLAPLRVVCHYESPGFAPNEESFQTLVHTSSELELILLRDFEWVAREFEL